MIRAGRENVIQRALIIETWPTETDAALINQESEETGKLRTPWEVDGMNSVGQALTPHKLLS